MDQQSHPAEAKRPRKETTPHPRNSRGGSMASGGLEYQAHCAAWFAVQILAETMITPRWNLPVVAALTFVRCETEEPVDDILLGTSDGGFIFLQAKRTLDLSDKPDSFLADALDQCVRQYLQYPEPMPDVGYNPWQRTLDPLRDRLVIVTSGRSSAPIRIALPEVLRRIRTLIDGQPLTSAAVNALQQRALEILLLHARRSWVQERGIQPTEVQLQAFLSLLYLDTLDVDPGQPDEERAVERLQAVILRDPTQGRMAWNHLCTRCRKFITTSSGANLRDLQEHMSREQLALHGTPSFRADIEVLRRLTRANLTALKEHTRLQVGTTHLSIQRDCTAELMRNAESSSFAVVGDPGAGKTGLLVEAAQTLSDSGCDLVFLIADDLVSTSNIGWTALSRLGHSLDEALANWPGITPAMLFIDALDAARSEPQARQLSRLLQPFFQPDSRWHVVASVRLFDLAHSPTLRQMFAGTLDEPDMPEDTATLSRSPAFADVRHQFVAALTDRELQQVTDQSAAFGALLVDASPALRQLLRNPFNLNLAGVLLYQGVSSAQLGLIRTQLDLLDRYWIARVLTPGNDRGTVGSTRERILRTMCDQLVASRRLSMAYWDLLSVLGGGEDERALEVLLQQRVLVRRDVPARLIGSGDEEQAEQRYTGVEARHTTSEIVSGSVLTFDHLILFDYAVARLILRSFTIEALAFRFANERDLILTLAPSLTLHFHYLWTRTTPGTGTRHGAFWATLESFMALPAIPWVTKIQGPTLAAQLAMDIGDIEPLLTVLTEAGKSGRTNTIDVSHASDASSRNKAAEEIYRHLIDALPVSDRPLIGPEAGPWCELAERVATDTQLLRIQTALPTGALLARLCEHPDQLTVEQSAAAGNAARHLLEFAERLPERHTWLIQRAIEAVCWTSASAPAASETLLRKCLAPERVAIFGYEELPLLARQLEWLITTIPVFVSNLYHVAYTYTEVSQETTMVNRSQIFGFTSNRRQDYELGLHSLVKAFPTFLRQHPRYAVATCLDVVNHAVIERYPVDDTPYTFLFAGREARLRPDDSDWWNHVRRVEDGPLPLLEALTAYLAELANTASESNDPDARERSALLGELLALIAEHAEVALIWGRLLRVGAVHPATLGHALAGLLEALPVLTARETRYEAGEMLKQVYPELDIATRERVERVLLGLSDDVAPAHRDAIERTRNQLLGCLPDQVHLEAVRIVRDSLRERNALPRNIPSIVVGGGWMHDDIEADEEADEVEGDKALAPVRSPEDTKDGEKRTLEAAISPVSEFVKQHQQAMPTRADLNAIWNALLTLYATLEKAKQMGADTEMLVKGWSNLVESCALVAQIPPDLDPPANDSEVAMTFVRNMLYAASEYAHPRPNPERDAQRKDTESLSWSDADLRVPGAAGLIVLAQHPGYLDEDLHQALQRLASDPVAAVRWQIATRLVALNRSDPNLMWALAERFASEETICPVLRAVVNPVLARLAGSFPDRALPLVERIYDRIADVEGMDPVRVACMDIFLGQALWRDNVASAARVQTMVGDPLQWIAEVEHTLHTLRPFLAHGLPLDERASSSDRQAVEKTALDAQVRRRAHDLFGALIRAVTEEINRQHAQHDDIPWNAWSEADRKQLSLLSKLIHTAATELYFASGAYAREEESHGRTAGANAVRLTDSQRTRFYTEMEDIFIQLADIGDVGVAHEVLQTLAEYIDVAPAGVLQLIGRAIRAATTSGYHYESLAVDLLVDVVEQYLADYRVLFQDSEEYRILLLDILDGFVAAGWPRARKLVGQLDVIYR